MTDEAALMLPLEEEEELMPREDESEDEEASDSSGGGIPSKRSAECSRRLGEPGGRLWRGWSSSLSSCR